MVKQAVLVACALAACSVPGVDYTGKACPCPSGYVCNTPTQTCTRELPQDASGRDSITPPLPDGAIDAAVTNSCLQGAYAHLAYSTATFADFGSAWMTGNGNWTTGGGELEQANSAVTNAFVYHPTVGGAANYRVVSDVHAISVSTGSSLGVAVRVNGVFAQMYACELQKDQLALVRIGDLQTTKLGSVPVSTTDTATMELQVTGTSLSCCIDGVLGTLVTASDSQYTSGGIGLVTDQADAGFSQFSLYTP